MCVRGCWGGGYSLDLHIPIQLTELSSHIKYYCFHILPPSSRRELLDERPYLSEAGPVVFDALYDTVIRQVSYIVKSPSLNRNMISLHTLIKHSINVLIGVPSETFHLDKVCVKNSVINVMWNCKSIEVYKIMKHYLINRRPLQSWCNLIKQKFARRKTKKFRLEWVSNWCTTSAVLVIQIEVTAWNLVLQLLN